MAFVRGRLLDEADTGAIGAICVASPERAGRLF
jgi:hypothetical protein